ncbi:ATP phosphoribosyltransferase [Gloeobacter kilaueensis]|uniref:ATP phosphoribosyltransferase n=1 Tax=Gloeobacter kilaueensis (strain ATCC BAA-2537 / CCAP 1431/1 / ULC 316 / JS1) TaxID=1183438 RepID=U5QCH4_GLOK1|nr:ATP phosphoribosyltransferase [Gloeobacter kilaueensis]AGY56617.1 ATP phosphoribosyltransferase catalytic subunit [Gloeobacter kilaueensis JS1]
MTAVTIALPKGALLKETVLRLQQLGIDFGAFLESSNRLLRLSDRSGRYEGLLVRAQDVPVYVAYGQAQVGVVGFDVLQEKQLPVAQVADLGFGYCRMSVAVKGDSPYRQVQDLPAHCRVASKFVTCARLYFDELQLPVELISLYGSVELAPLTGMAEAIVDLVSSGRTLRENGLVEIATIYDSTARLIAHPLSYRLGRNGLHPLLQQIQSLSATGSGASRTS